MSSKTIGSEFPCWGELRAKDMSRELNFEDASKYRQAVGTALYISCDRPDVGYAVRMLAAYMARPTEHARVGLVKLLQYLINTSDYGILMKFAAPGTRKLNSYLHDTGCADDAERAVLEVFSDADWSGSKKDRKSYGGASFCLNGTYIHYICRSQFELDGKRVLQCRGKRLPGAFHEGRHRVYEPEPL